MSLISPRGADHCVVDKLWIRDNAYVHRKCSLFGRGYSKFTFIDGKLEVSDFEHDLDAKNEIKRSSPDR
jgi:hypothetical protein